MTDQLVPKAPRKKLQPTVAWYRQTVVDLTAENIRLRSELEQARKPFWRRLRKSA